MIFISHKLYNLHMNTQLVIPKFNEELPDLHKFILGLVADYHTGRISSWEDLEQRVTGFFTHERMEQMEATLPHWQKMASYYEGITLIHVMCVFLGLYMLPEYQSLAPSRQNLMQWIILLHDVEKKPAKRQRDPFHAFRSAVTAARRLPSLGFETTHEYASRIGPWSELVLSACVQPAGAPEPIQDNRRFPEILEGIDQMFGKESAAGAIVKTVLLHTSFNVVKEWPQAAPLTIDEITRYVDRDLLPLLKVMMLSDNEGWSIFYPDRDTQRSDTLEVYEELEKLIH
jgi:hypothetical protein